MFLFCRSLHFDNLRYRSSITLRNLSVVFANRVNMVSRNQYRNMMIMIMVMISHNNNRGMNMISDNRAEFRSQGRGSTSFV